MPDDPTPRRLLASEVLAEPLSPMVAAWNGDGWEPFSRDEAGEYQVRALLACVPDDQDVLIRRQTLEVEPAPRLTEEETELVDAVRSWASTHKDDRWRRLLAIIDRLPLPAAPGEGRDTEEASRGE